MRWWGYRLLRIIEEREGRRERPGDRERGAGRARGIRYGDAGIEAIAGRANCGTTGFTISGLVVRKRRAAATEAGHRSSPQPP